MTPELPRHPLLPGLYHIVPLDDDRVQICNSARTVVLSGQGFGHRLPPLLRALDGTSTVAELEARFAGLVPRVLEELARRGLLADGSPDRSSNATASMLPAEGGPGAAARRLADATVIVVGCGPVARSAGLLLARSGVGRMVMVDEGEVSPSDVAASPSLGRAFVGRRRSELARMLCAPAGARVETSRECSREQLAAANLAVVEHRYRDDGLHLQADIALATGTPYLCHGQDALEAVVGPLVAPGGSPCHRCFDSRRLSHVVHVDEHLAYLRHRSEHAPAPIATMPSHTELLAGILASEVLAALAQPERRAAAGALDVDLSTLEVRREPVVPVPGCTGCATAAAASC